MENLAISLLLREHWSCDLCCNCFSSFAKSLAWNVHTHSQFYCELQLACAASFSRNKKRSLLSEALYGGNMSSTIIASFVAMSLFFKPITSVSHECMCPLLLKMKADPSPLSTGQSHHTGLSPAFRQVPLVTPARLFWFMEPESRIFTDGT